MAANTYVAIDSKTTVGTTAYVEFTNIPQTYTNLVIVCSVKDSGTGTVNTQCQVGNGSYDTNANYSWTWMGGSGSAAASGRGSNQSSFLTGAISTSSFSITTLYFNNYSSTTVNKTMLSRNSNSDSSSGQAVSAWAGTWRSNSAINQIKLYPGGQSFATGCTFTMYGILADNTSFVSATGGTLYSDATYNYHVFNSSGIFEITGGSKSCSILMVGGGGGGGCNQGGGGGAGGMYELTSQTLTAGKNRVLIGAGGAGSAAAVYGDATNGGNTVFGNFAPAIGGGKGASYSFPANSGGSGGGGAGGGSANGSGTSGQGNAGGTGGWYGAGGGGKTSSGTSTPSSNNAVPGAGNGGAGATSTVSGGSVTAAGQLSSGSYYFAGGGGGGSTASNLSGAPGTGGVGGGGAGQAQNYNSPAVAGTANTGGGGGAGNQGGSGYNTLGMAGGSGIVIIKYAR